MAMKDRQVEALKSFRQLEGKDLAGWSCINCFYLIGGKHIINSLGGLKFSFTAVYRPDGRMIVVQDKKLLLEVWNRLAKYSIVRVDMIQALVHKTTRLGFGIVKLPSLESQEVVCKRLRLCNSEEVGKIDVAWEEYVFNRSDMENANGLPVGF